MTSADPARRPPRGRRGWCRASRCVPCRARRPRRASPWTTAAGVVTSTNPTGPATAWHAAVIDAAGAPLRALACPSERAVRRARRARQRADLSDPHGGAQAWSVEPLPARTCRWCCSARPARFASRWTTMATYWPPRTGGRCGYMARGREQWARAVRDAGMPDAPTAAWALPAGARSPSRICRRRDRGVGHGVARRWAADDRRRLSDPHPLRDRRPGRPNSRRRRSCPCRPHRRDAVRRRRRHDRRTWPGMHDDMQRQLPAREPRHPHGGPGRRVRLRAGVGRVSAVGRVRWSSARPRR